MHRLVEGPTSGFLWLADESAALRNFSPAERAQMAEQELHHFPQPPLNSTVWKYLDTFKLEYLLKEQALYLRQVAALANDEPNEGVMNQFQHEAMRKNSAGNPKQFEELLHFTNSLRERAWVTCLSLGDFEEPRMWKEYCTKRENEGVAIKSTYRKLWESLGEVAGLAHPHPYIAQVRYREDAEVVPKLGYLIYQKLPRFIHEREVRVCAFSPEQKFLESPGAPNHVNLPVRLPQLIQQIRVHPKASDDYFRKIKSLTAKYLPKRQARVRWSLLRGRF